MSTAVRFVGVTETDSLRSDSPAPGWRAGPERRVCGIGLRLVLGELGLDDRTSRPPGPFRGGDLGDPRPLRPGRHRRAEGG